MLSQYRDGAASMVRQFVTLTIHSKGLIFNERAKRTATASHDATESHMTKVNVGKSIEIDIDFTTIPQAAIDHILYIGARNILMDAHASITSDEYPNADERQAAAGAMVQKKLDALMRGEVRVQGTREGDPVRAEALRMATDIVKAKIKRSGKKASSFDAKDIRGAAMKLITPELLAQAQARVDEIRAVDAGDLTDLGL